MYNLLLQSNIDNIIINKIYQNSQNVFILISIYLNTINAYKTIKMSCSLENASCEQTYKQKYWLMSLKNMY